jgi:hypothetical protein
MSITPLGTCTDAGPTSSGLEHAEAAALDHRGPAHAERDVLGRDDDVAAAREHGVAGEAAARHDAHERHLARELRERVNASRCEHAGHHDVGVAGAAAAALREDDDAAAAAARRSRACDPSSRGSSCPACRRAPCSRTRAPCSARRVVEQVAVHAADAGDEAVGGRAVDQLVEAAPAALRGDEIAAVLLEAEPRRRDPRCSRAPCAARSCAGVRRPPGERHRAWQPRVRGARRARVDQGLARADSSSCQLLLGGLGSSGGRAAFAGRALVDMWSTTAEIRPRVLEVAMREDQDRRLVGLLEDARLFSGPPASSAFGATRQ